MRENSKKIKRHDFMLNLITYLSSMISVVILLTIFFFIFSKGASLINFDLLKNDYWSKNYLVAPQLSEPGLYQKPLDLDESAIFSKRWGIALKDHISHEKEAQILIAYIDDDSPFAKTYDQSAGETQGQLLSLEKDMQLLKVDFINELNVSDFAGSLKGQNAAEMIDYLDTHMQKITSCYVKTTGGGIRGSLIATLYLILISLLIALPLGMASAIYLNEFALHSKFSTILRTGIETLNGVPSIIFGLMGVTVLFPITEKLGAQTTSILLGGLTLAIILLPVIIRSTEEALKVVPKSFRDGSLSLGATQAQTIFKIVLPSAMPGILSGVLLSVGRVIGESAALIYTMGTFINDSPTILSQGTSLAVHIWAVMSGEQPNFELACAISIIILLIVLGVNILIKLLSKKLNKAWY